MNFSDAVNNMLLGKRLIRQTWAGYYVAIIPGQSYIWEIGNTNTKPEPNITTYTPSIEDIKATDWNLKIT